MNDVNEYLNKHRLPNKYWSEYDNLKATLIASMNGTTLYKREIYLYGKRIVEILRP